MDKNKLKELKDELDTTILNCLLAGQINLSPAATHIYYGTKKADINYWSRQIEEIENKIKELEAQAN